MTLKYRVVIQHLGGNRPASLERAVRNLSLPKAWRVAVRAARRGRNTYGGRVAQSRWGVRGGELSGRYVSAGITTQA